MPEFVPKTWTKTPPPPSAPGRRRIAIEEGFKFFFDDPRWKSKLAILTLFMLLGCFVVGMPIVSGYLFRITKRTAARESPLPEWEDYGGLFLDGLRVMVLPIVALWPFVAAVLLLSILDSLISGSADPTNAFGWLVRVLWVLCLIGSVLVAAAYMPSVRIRVAVTDRFAAALEWRENLSLIRRNLENYLMSYGLFFLANMISNFGYLLCCIGIIPTTLWAVSVMSWGEGKVAELDPDFR